MATIDIYPHIYGDIKSDGTTDDAYDGLSAFNSTPSWRFYLAFDISPLAGATSIDNSQIVVNVIDTTADASEGLEFTPYEDSNGDQDPSADSGTTLYNNCFVSGHVWLDLECNSNGQKIGDLGAACDARILANASGSGLLSLGVSSYGLDFGEYVTIDSPDGPTPSNKPFLRVTYTPSMAVSGTATATITESDVVAGAKTVVLTLSGEEWIDA